MGFAATERRRSFVRAPASYGQSQLQAKRKAEGGGAITGRFVGECAFGVEMASKTRPEYLKTPLPVILSTPKGNEQVFYSSQPTLKGAVGEEDAAVEVGGRVERTTQLCLAIHVQRAVLAGKGFHYFIF